MMKNKCEVLPEEEDWGFEATAQLVVGFQGLKFRNEEDDDNTWVSTKLPLMFSSLKCLIHLNLVTTRRWCF